MPNKTKLNMKSQNETFKTLKSIKQKYKNKNV